MFLSKDDNLSSSPQYLGYLILKVLEGSENKKVTIFDIVDKFKAEFGIVHYQQVLFALMFLFQADIVDFSEPYIYVK